MKPMPSKYEPGRAKDGKICYRIRTAVDVTDGMDWTRQRADSSAERAYRQTRQDEGKWTVALSWSELLKLHELVSAGSGGGIGDRSFRKQVLGGLPAQPTRPRTKSYGVFDTTPEERLESLNRYFGNWGEWDDAMRTVHGFAITGICAVRAILNDEG